MNIHQNGRITPASRAELVARVLDDRLSVRLVAAAAGVCPRTVRKWVARYQTDGPAGLIDRSSRPARLADGVGSLKTGSRTRPAHAEGRLVYNGADRDERGAGAYAQLAALFEVDHRTLERWVARWRTARSVEPQPRAGGWCPLIDLNVLRVLAREVPDATIAEMCAEYNCRAP